jgi:hypothetical protein
MAYLFLSLAPLFRELDHSHGEGGEIDHCSIRRCSVQACYCPDGGLFVFDAELAIAVLPQGFYKF